MKKESLKKETVHPKKESVKKVTVHHEPINTENTEIKAEKNPILIGDYSLFSILAFIFGFIFWPIAFIFGLMALGEIRRYPNQIHAASKWLAWAGILIQPILVIFALLFFQSILSLNGFSWFNPW